MSRRDDNEWAEVAAKLKQAPVGVSLGVKARWLGSLVDATTLRRRGWTLVEAGRKGEPVRWEGCLWWEKDFGDQRAELGTSWFLEKQRDGGMREVPKRRARALARSEGTARIYARAVRFTVASPGGLSRVESLPEEVPDEAWAGVAADLSESELEAHEGFLEDLAFQADGWNGCEPETTEERLIVLDDILKDCDRRGDTRVAERLLVRWVRAAAEPESDPAGAAALEELSDGRVVWNLLYRWDLASMELGARWRLLGWALEREPGWTHRFSGIAWPGVGALLWEFGLRREGLRAMERALAEEDAEDGHAEFFWSMVQEYWDTLETASDQPEDVAWYVQLLHRHEERFGGREGYWTLLGLALALNGNDPGVAARTVGEGGESGPREREARRCAESGDLRWVRRALRAYPEAAGAREWGAWDLPEYSGQGISDYDLLNAVTVPEEMGHGETWQPPDVEPLSWGEWRAFPPPASYPLPDGSEARAWRTWRVFGPGATEVDLLHMQITADPKRADPTARHTGRDAWHTVPWPRAPEGCANVRAVAWKASPCPDGGVGGIEMRLAGGKRKLPAFCARFAEARETVPRGVPMPAWLCGLGLMLRIGDPRMLPGMRFFHVQPGPASQLVYAFRGEARAVRRVGVAGGGEALRIELDAGGELPCVLPLYIRESLVEKRPGSRRKTCAVRKGDILEGCLALSVEFLPPDAEAEAWIAAHPEGADPRDNEDVPSPVGGFIKADVAAMVGFKVNEDGTLGGMDVPLPGGFALGDAETEAMGGEQRQEGLDHGDVPPPAGGMAQANANNTDRVEAGPGGNFETLGIPLSGGFVLGDSALDEKGARDLDVRKLAEIVLRLRADGGRCEEWDSNPRGIDFGSVVDGQLRLWRVVKAFGDDPAPRDVPDGIDCLVVRIRDAGLIWRVEYEGLP